MRNWFSRHPIWFMAFYLVFYLSVFHWLEVNITVPEVWVHCHLDDLIPFCKYAVIPYLAWFIWIPFTLFYLLWKAPRADFWRLCLPLFAGMTIALAVYVILPNGLDLRPYRVYGSDIFARIVRLLYSTVLLKQHSCIDVVMGILLAMAVDSAATSLERSEYRILQNP